MQQSASNDITTFFNFSSFGLDLVCIFVFDVGAVLLNLLIDVFEALLDDVGLTLRLVDDAVTTFLVVVAAIFGLVDLGSWLIFILLLHHHFINLVLSVLVLEVSPLGQDLHGLNVFNGRQLLSIVLISAKSVEVDLFAESLVFVLHDLQDGVDLLTIQYLLVVHTCN